MSDEIRDAKRALRTGIREGRRWLSVPQRRAAATALGEHLDALVARLDARTVSCFLSTPTEPGTHDFVARAVGRGIRVLLPRSGQDGVLDWALAADDGQTTTGRFGIAEPTGPSLGPDALHAVDLMLIPAAAVDRTGTRLGWGRGYFDRAIAALPAQPPVFAVTYDAEVLDSLPREAHDQPITGVVTPSGILTLLSERH